jgi:hypothetical protein
MLRQCRSEDFLMTASAAETDWLFKSEQIIAAILSLLLKRGVRKTEICAQDVADNGSDDSANELFEDAIFWLRHEGIIRFDQYTEDSFIDCTLTAYGFAILGQKLHGSPENETVGTAVKRISSNKTNLSPVGDFIGGLLGGLTKSLGSG